MKKVIIFDLDGTLLYTLEDLMNSVNYALNKYAYPTRTMEEISSFVGNGVKHLLKQALPQGIEDNEFEQCFDCFKEHYSEHCCELTHPYEGVLETLKILKDKGLKIGIVSNKFQSAAEEVCEFYFKDLYDIVMGESEECRRKPSPDGINKICERYGVEKDEVIFFGDSEVDIKTAENASVYCVSVLWGFRDREFLTENGASLFVNNPLDIVDMVD